MSIRLLGFACSGSTVSLEPGGSALEERLAALRPWLEAELGAGATARMDAWFEDQLGTLDVVRCPTVAERARSRAQFRRQLEELERRSRQWS